MNVAAYSEDQYDAIREIANVAMGRAANSLARLLDRFIKLPVPSVRFVEASRVADALRDVVADYDSVTAVRQAFSGRTQGEAIVLFCGESFLELAELLGHQGGDDVLAHQELILDVSNLLVGACIGGIADQLGYELSYSPPSIIVEREIVDRVLEVEKVPWSHALLLAVNFRVEGKTFLCYVLAFWPDEALLMLRDAIDRFLESL